MQERYLGDSHDFIKYALLRLISEKIDIRLGVNWYLTIPEDVDAKHSNDGEKRHHLTGGKWKKWDSDLFERLAPFSKKENRKLENVKKWGILPANTIYFDKKIPAEGREAWHTSAMTHLENAGLVFMDPDNGFEVSSMTRKRSPKYSFYREAFDYFSRGQTVIGIQFAGRNKPVKDQALNLLTRLHNKIDDPLPIVRGHTAPNILFATLAQKNMQQKLANIFAEFVSRSSGKTELIVESKARSLDSR